MEVLEERHGLLHVRFHDGADTWASRDMLYALSASAPTPDAPDADPSRFPLRRPDPTPGPLAGAHVLAYWISDGVLQRAQPWRAQVIADQGEQLSLRYSDGTEADVPRTAVLRVFRGAGGEEAAPGNDDIALGNRVWLDGSVPVGTVVEERAGLIKVRAGEGTHWVEMETVLAVAPSIGPEQLSRGTLVTALWSGTTLYHGTVLGVSGEEVTIGWHDGSTPSAVPLRDIVEIWQRQDS